LSQEEQESFLHRRAVYRKTRARYLREGYPATVSEISGIPVKYGYILERRKTIMEDPRRNPPRSLWREFDEMMAAMENRFQNIMKGVESQGLLPAPGFQRRLVPAYMGEFHVDVKEHADEVIVVADLPGVEKTDITISLIDPRTLYISSRREEEREEKEEGYYLHERTRGSMERTIALPADVTDEEARATFNNGVLEIRLRKKMISPEKRIMVE
jgi:HSP20 family protein